MYQSTRKVKRNLRMSQCKRFWADEAFGETWLCLWVILHLFVMKSDREEAYRQSLGADCKFESDTQHTCCSIQAAERF